MNTKHIIRWKCLCITLLVLWFVGVGQAEAQQKTSWISNATFLKGQIGKQFSYVCPPNGTAFKVWGSDIYTADSSICTAAVHAGKITLSGGGTVIIEMRPGASSYQSSSRNGITSISFKAYDGSFVFAGGTRTPIDLNGSWGNRAVHIWHEGNQVFATATWKWKGKYRICKAQGTLSGNTVTVHAINYSSMTHGPISGSYTANWYVSADSQTITPKNYHNGQPLNEPGLIWRRDP